MLTTPKDWGSELQKCCRAGLEALRLILKVSWRINFERERFSKMTKLIYRVVRFPRRKNKLRM